MGCHQVHRLLAACGSLREMCRTPLPKQVLAYVMQDEARHVEFGRLALRDADVDLTAAERADREEFVDEVEETIAIGTTV